MQPTPAAGPSIDVRCVPALNDSRQPIVMIDITVGPVRFAVPVMAATADGFFDQVATAGKEAAAAARQAASGLIIPQVDMAAVRQQLSGNGSQPSGPA